MEPLIGVDAASLPWPREALRLRGERVNRLEADLWEAIRQNRRPEV